MIASLYTVRYISKEIAASLDVENPPLERSTVHSTCLDE